MKKIILSVMMLCCFSLATSIASEIYPTTEGRIVNLVLRSHTIDDSVINEGHHRTSVRVPNIYFNQESGTLIFEDPCYECTLELVIPGTDTAVYCSDIEDGAETYQLPTTFSGTYELHIHRGNYCFYGEIEL